MHEIHVLTKRRHSKWFDSRASGLVRDVYVHCFPASPIVTKRAVRKCRIVHVLWAEANGAPFAAAMVARTSQGCYRVCGLGVMPANQRQGYGTALLKKICEILPERALLLLGVDKDTPTTEQLCAWYIRQGFARLSEQPDEIILAKELWSSGHEEGEGQSESRVY